MYASVLISYHVTKCGHGQKYSRCFGPSQNPGHATGNSIMLTFAYDHTCNSNLPLLRYDGVKPMSKTQLSLILEWISLSSYLELSGIDW